MITRASLISVKNLELAWFRIATGKNLQHKRFFRHIYGAYEPGLDANLTLLHEKLIGGWKATPPMRVYLPKTSGLLRPITLLAIEDQIVLQAIANKMNRDPFQCVAARDAIGNVEICAGQGTEMRRTLRARRCRMAADGDYLGRRLRGRDYLTDALP